MKKEINFVLNGNSVSIEVEPNEKLLDVLRDKVGVKSPKYGCGRGECGSCTVLLNGKSIRSCITLAIEVDGQEITTLEGLQKDGITPLQKSFIEHNAFQCGFCAPGMTMTATELLNKDPHPDEEEIREAIAGNLCRCTGYDTIVKAILDVAEKK